VAAFVVTTEPSYADETNDRLSLVSRPHTVAEVDVGFIALPNAPLSAQNAGGSVPFGAVGKGDATVMLGLHLLYRAGRDWAIGAGAMFAPQPTSDVNYGGQSGLPRTHSRSYLVMGGEVRYFPLRYRWVEGWVGATAGGVIVADRYTTNSGDQVPEIFGSNQVTVNTEGFSAGVEVGGDYLVTESWVIGLALRIDRWFLPEQSRLSCTPGSPNCPQPTWSSACDSVGDCPTLAGSVAAFQFGATLGYRIPF
jgi:hypothetical protein